MSTASSELSIGLRPPGESPFPRDRSGVSPEFGRAPRPAPVLPRSTWYPPVKHVVDFVAAALLLLPAVPVILFAAGVTKLTSSGPAFYWQTRLGRGGRPFLICKIRTMVQDAEAKTGPVWCPGGTDPRVTPWGRFLRRTHLDEFPQLFQVLTGHMSLIGPRPERPEFVRRLEWEVPLYGERLNAKPGVTGLAQLVLPPDADLEDVRRKVRHDLYYIRFMGPWLDAVIIAHTAKLLLKSVLAAFESLRLPRGEVVDRSIADLEPYEDAAPGQLGGPFGLPRREVT